MKNRPRKRASVTKAEQETILRYDQEDPCASLYTAYERDARRWKAKLSYPVEVERTRNGVPTGWRARVPRAAIRLRALGPDGQVRRRAKPAGKPFGPREFALSDERTVAELNSE